jgi:isopenicillin-N epimerase
VTSPSELWTLDPSVAFLNHGSFGACPAPVLAAQSRWRARMEAEPVLFLMRELEDLLDAARARLAAFVGADADDLAFVHNATGAVNTVVRSLPFDAGDELLTTDHAYNACANALRFVAERAGARVVVAPVPFPISSPAEVTAAVLAHVSDRTRLALIDHITSPTGVIFPVADLARALSARGVDVLVDGAHAPGMVPLDVGALGALGVTYYTGNLHKWVCAPKGAAFLWVRRDRQPDVRPLVISHAANTGRTDRSRFRLEFDWQGTHDPTAWLCVPDALDAIAALEPDGWPEVMAKNHALTVQARDLLASALGVDPPAPEGMLGSLAALPLPGGDPGPGALPGSGALDPLQDALWHAHRIEVPVFAWPAPPTRFIRVACQRYNTIDQYERLAAALQTLLA